MIPSRQVQSITARDPAQNTLMTRSYQYSPSGNITSKGTEHGTYTYQYDELYRLISAVNPTISDEAYTYDAIGNRLTSSDTTELWSYNENNELNAHNGVTYEYDDNGNMIQKSMGEQNVNYIYDVEDRLVQVEDGDGIVATYYYDPFGRRLWKDVDGTRTYFLYSDEGLIGEYDSTGNEIKTYGWTPDSIWGKDPLFLKIDGYYYFYQNDHQGTPQKLIGTNGLVVWAGVYDSFGNCQVEVEGITNNLRFPGQYYDEETGLHYNWYRYYDPGTGRYLRTDPSGTGLNLYTYVSNNPVNLFDPRGLCAVNAIGPILSYGGIALGLAGFFTGNPLLGAFGLSLSAHGLILSHSNYLSMSLGIGGAVIGGIGFFTGNPLLVALGISLSIHAAMLELPSSPSPPDMNRDYPRKRE